MSVAPKETASANPLPPSAEEIETIINNIHEMVIQYGGEGAFDDWCKLRALIRKLQVKKIAPKDMVDLNECGRFFDAIVDLIRTYQKEHRMMKETLEELKTWGHSDECAEDDDGNVVDCICSQQFVEKALSSLTL